MKYWICAYNGRWGEFLREELGAKKVCVYIMPHPNDVSSSWLTHYKAQWFANPMIKNARLKCKKVWQENSQVKMQINSWWDILRSWYIAYCFYNLVLIKKTKKIKVTAILPNTGDDKQIATIHTNSYNQLSDIFNENSGAGCWDV